MLSRTPSKSAISLMREAALAICARPHNKTAAAMADMRRQKRVMRCCSGNVVGSTARDAKPVPRLKPAEIAAFSKESVLARGNPFRAPGRFCRAGFGVIKSNLTMPSPCWRHEDRLVTEASGDDPAAREPRRGRRIELRRCDRQ